VVQRLLVVQVVALDILMERVVLAPTVLLVDYGTIRAAAEEVAHQSLEQPALRLAMAVMVALARYQHIEMVLQPPMPLVAEGAQET